MLDHEGGWFTPENIREYQARSAADSDEPPALPTVISNDQGHPPLSSPVEPSSQAVRGVDTQFHTQAPPMMDESQLRRKQDEAKEEVAEESEEKDYSWEPTQVPKVQETKRPQAISTPEKISKGTKGSGRTF